jgi:hypothetical protein
MPIPRNREILFEWFKENVRTIDESDALEYCTAFNKLGINSVVIRDVIMNKYDYRVFKTVVDNLSYTTTSSKTVKDKLLLSPTPPLSPVMVTPINPVSIVMDDSNVDSNPAIVDSSDSGKVQ